MVVEHFGMKSTCSVVLKSDSEQSRRYLCVVLNYDYSIGHNY
jgi:hypothetical protein